MYFYTNVQLMKENIILTSHYIKQKQSYLKAKAQY